jgi:activator of 2-hydroxyglutaryl-CoA dehydratase
LGHLFYDAPEVLVGLACAVFGGLQVKKSLINNKSKKSKISTGLMSSIITGYLGYIATKKIKNYLE